MHLHPPHTSPTRHASGKTDLTLFCAATQTPGTHQLRVSTPFSPPSIAIQTVSLTTATLEQAAPLLDAIFCGRPEPAAVFDAFVDIWKTHGAASFLQSSIVLNCLLACPWKQLCTKRLNRPATTPPRCRLLSPPPSCASSAPACIQSQRPHTPELHLTPALILRHQHPQPAQAARGHPASALGEKQNELQEFLVFAWVAQRPSCLRSSHWTLSITSRSRSTMRAVILLTSSVSS